MHRSFTAYISLLISFLGNFVLYAQESQRISDLPLEPTPKGQKSASIMFERNLNTFNWLGNAIIDTSLGRFSIRLNELFTSNIILIEGTSSSPERRLQSNQHNLSLLQGWHLSPEVTTRVKWTSLVYSDNKAVGLSNASFHSLLGGIDYSPYPLVSLSPMVGYRWDNQAGVNDRGFSYDIAGRTILPLDIDGYQLSASAQYHEDLLDPRVLQTHYARFSAQKSFVTGARDSLVLYVGRKRREFYAFADAGTISGAFSAPADTNVESRIEDIFSFTNLLDYEIVPRFTASLFVNVSSRKLDKDIRYVGSTEPRTLQFNTAIDEFRLDTYLQAAYRSHDGEVGASARLYHSERDEAHVAKPIEDASPNVKILLGERNKQEQTKDNFARRTALSGMVKFPLSPSDRISISGTASILRYDTPSEANFDDRDELLVALSIATSHRISQYLDVAVSLDGHLSHVVYLLENRSANNNYNRVLRLSPRVAYRPFKDLITLNTFEVLANYTVYDFEQQAALVRSFSYRQFGWVDSTSVQLTPRIGLDLFTHIRLYERGQLRWSEFTERTENSFRDETYALQVRFTPYNGIIFAVGFRHFSQSRYAHGDNGKTLDSVVRSIGPTCIIQWRINSYSQLGIKGWYERRSQTDGATRTLANMTMNVYFTL
ncbi:MAG: hypothetical protein O7D34_04365 [Ignavibacteria bacterium]|nr:hypothetical protein [Ignavibacteria bacterium]